MLDALGVVAVIVGLILAVTNPSLLVWVLMGVAVVLVVGQKIEERKKR